MSVIMNMDRIRRWKCLFCGSKQKRKIDMVGATNGKKIGYSLMCCNCGNINNFALSSPGVEVFTCGTESKVDRIQINCALPPEDLQFCKNLNCKYRPKINKEENKQPSIAPNPTETIVTERKYQ